MTLVKRPSAALNLVTKSVIRSTPRLYAQDGLGDQAVVHLHLFGPMGDWWITELNEDGTEGFGYIKLAAFGDCAELGYVSITELQDLVDEKFIGQHNLKALIERDLHWTPTTLGEVRKANPRY